MGMGLAMWGFVGKNGIKNWRLLIGGSAVVFAIRPQVCAVLLFSFVAAQWLAKSGRRTVRSRLQAMVVVILSFSGILLGMNVVGVESFDLVGVQEYVEASSAISTSGSTVEQVEIGLRGIPMAVVNILVRPFIWESTNVMHLASALEVIALWAIIWYRRRNLRRAMKTWRSHPMLRVAVPFIIVYTVSLGIMLVNLGIIARQRIFLFPFLFLLLEAEPAVRRMSRRRGRGRGGGRDRRRRTIRPRMISRRRQEPPSFP
jgi:hypothetical protein